SLEAPEARAWTWVVAAVLLHQRGAAVQRRPDRTAPAHDREGGCEARSHGDSSVSREADHRLARVRRGAALERADRQQAGRRAPRDHEQGLQVLRWRRDAREGALARRGSIARARRQAVRLAVLDPVAAEALLHALQDAARAPVPDRLRARRSLYVGRFWLRIRL